MKTIPNEGDLSLYDVRKREFGEVCMIEKSYEEDLLELDYDEGFRIPKEKIDLKDIPFAFTAKKVEKMDF